MVETIDMSVRSHSVGTKDCWQITTCTDSSKNYSDSGYHSGTHSWTSHARISVSSANYSEGFITGRLRSTTGGMQMNFRRFIDGVKKEDYAISCPPAGDVTHTITFRKAGRTRETLPTYLEQLHKLDSYSERPVASSALTRGF